MDAFELTQTTTQDSCSTNSMDTQTTCVGELPYTDEAFPVWVVLSQYNHHNSSKSCGRVNSLYVGRLWLCKTKVLWERCYILIGFRTMMLPYQVTIIPLFILFRNFGWLNTHLPLIVPSYFGSPFYIFIMRQFFLNIPSELEDAAAIDGCSNIRTFWNVFLPLAKPAVVSVGLFTFMAKWNDFFNPLIYLNAPRKFTLTLGLASLNNEHGSEWNLLMAGSVMAMLPCLLLFFFFQRYFVEGLASSGIKG